MIQTTLQSLLYNSINFSFVLSFLHNVLEISIVVIAMDEVSQHLMTVGTLILCVCVCVCVCVC